MFVHRYDLESNRVAGGGREPQRGAGVLVARPGDPIAPEVANRQGEGVVFRTHQLRFEMKPGLDVELER